VVARVAVRLAIVPRDVKEDETTFEASVVPVSAEAATDPAEPETEPVIVPETVSPPRFAAVAKRLVEEAVVAKKFVVVAAVVVVFTRLARYCKVPSVVVALIRASARALVK